MYSWKNTSCSWLLSEVGPIANPINDEQCYRGPSTVNSTGKDLVGYGDKQEEGSEEDRSLMPNRGPRLEPEVGEDVDQMSPQQLDDMANKCRLARQGSTAAATDQYSDNSIKRSASPPPNKPAKKMRHGAIIFPNHSKSLVSEYIGNLLGKVPRDDIFCDCYSRVISLDTVINMHGYNEFKLASLNDSFYQLSQLIIEVRVKLVDDDGKTPGPNDDVAPENNVLHNLISELSVLINDQAVTGQPHLYPYKAYLHNMLRFDTECKQALLDPEGWVSDDTGYYDKFQNENAGFKARRDMFIKQKTDVGSVVYDDREVIFVGKLITDLIFLKEPLIPNSRATIKILWNSRPEFYMRQKAGLTKNYKLNIIAAQLHVTVLTPSADLRRTLMPRLKTEPVFYHFVETNVVTETIYNVSSHSSQNLIKDGATPIRVYIVFVKSVAFRGSYQKSPWDFRRLFEASAADEEEVELSIEMDEDDGEISDSDIPSNPEEMRAAFREHLEVMMGHAEASNVGRRGLLKAVSQGYDNLKKMFAHRRPVASAPSKGKGASAAGPSKGKAKSVQPSASQQEIPPPPYDSEEVRQGGNPAPTTVRQEPDPFGSTAYHFIQKCTLIADGKEISDIGGRKNTKYDATLDFVRFLKVTGQYGNQNSTVSVDLDLFNKNNYVVCFDLSTGGRSSLALSTVTTRSLIRAHTEFSDAVPYEITQVIFLLFNSCFSIDPHKNVQKSYNNASD